MARLNLKQGEFQLYRELLPVAPATTLAADPAVTTAAGKRLGQKYLIVPHVGGRLITGITAFFEVVGGASPDIDITVYLWDANLREFVVGTASATYSNNRATFELETDGLPAFLHVSGFTDPPDVTSLKIYAAPLTRHTVPNAR